VGKTVNATNARTEEEANKENGTDWKERVRTLRRKKKRRMRKWNETCKN
jgi:hypothetical protein